MKKYLILTIALLMICSSSIAQQETTAKTQKGGFMRVLKKNIESATGINMSDEPVFVYPELGVWRMSLISCEGDTNSGEITLRIKAMPLLESRGTGVSCYLLTATSGSGQKLEVSDKGATNRYDLPLLSFTEITFEQIVNAPVNLKTIDVRFVIGNEIPTNIFELRNAPIHWATATEPTAQSELAQNASTAINNKSDANSRNISQASENEEEWVRKWVPGRVVSQTSSEVIKKGYTTSETKKYTVTKNVYTPPQLLTTTRNVPKTASRYTYIPGRVIPVHVIESGEEIVATIIPPRLESYMLSEFKREIIARKMPAECVGYISTDYFYIDDPEHKILDLSREFLSEDQMYYSAIFTTSKEPFPIWKTQKPWADMGAKFTANNKSVSEANAPDEVKELFKKFFTDRNRGYIYVEPGKTEFEKRDAISINILQRNYMRFMGDIQDSVIANDIYSQTIKFSQDKMTIGDREIRYDKVFGDEGIMLAKYIAKNPHRERKINISADKTAKSYLFEYQLSAPDIIMFSLVLSPLTIRYEVVSYYDQSADATFYLFYQSFGYSKNHFVDNFKLVNASRDPEKEYENTRAEMIKDMDVDMVKYPLDSLDLYLLNRIKPLYVETVSFDVFESFMIRTANYLVPAEVKFDTIPYIKWSTRYDVIGDRVVKEYFITYEPVTETKLVTGGWSTIEQEKQRKYIVYHKPERVDVTRSYWLPPYFTYERSKPKVQKAITSPVTPGEPKPKDETVQFDSTPLVLAASSVTFAMIKGLAARDIAEDSRFIYLIATVNSYDYPELYAIEKSTGAIKIVYPNSEKEKSEYPRKVMKTPDGAVLVQISKFGIYQCKGFDPIEANDKTPYFYKNDWGGLLSDGGGLFGVLPSGDLIIAFGHDDVWIVDKVSGVKKGKIETLEVSGTDYKRNFAITPQGDIWIHKRDNSKGFIEVYKNPGTSSQSKTVQELGTMLKGGRVAECLTIAPNGSIYITTDDSFYSSLDGGNSWKQAKRDDIFNDRFWNTMYDKGNNPMVIYQKGYGVYELRKYLPDLSKGVSKLPLKSKLALYVNKSLQEGKTVQLEYGAKLTFMDQSDNLWILDGMNGDRGILIVNPSGIVGYTDITNKKMVDIPK